MSLDPRIDDLARLLDARLPTRALVGISGAVCVGKSTIAAALAGRLTALGREVDILCTDAFLYPNADLDERGLTFRKGFPETFNVVRLEQSLIGARRGAIDVPVYSHATYDVVPDASVQIAADTVIVEGVNVLQDPARRHLDVAIYVDADDAAVKEWFTRRFLALRDGGRSDPGSFYASMADLDDDAIAGLASGVWESVNAPNLEQHIRPSRDTADVIVEKGPAHQVTAIIEQ
ncbi:MAG TPA: hypothetical protein VI916_04930 [Acidimicrobiia bacterium]|nr:hypothetical protein [Acidimicrobiia bacterium]